jgi:hypothetical protein
LRHEEDGKDKKPVAQFVSKSEVESYNVAKQYAKQNKCLIRVTEAQNLETPELPKPPEYL